jgi:DNA-binding response OmpR family regulator
LNTVLVVEHRDEVFARIQADLAAWGTRVVRATGAEEARRLYCRRPTGLVLTHADLPDETGWLFACKLRLGRPAARIWVYTPRWTTKESVLAEFIGVEETIVYAGDLHRLSAEILDRLVTSSLLLPPPVASAERKLP